MKRQRQNLTPPMSSPCALALSHRKSSAESSASFSCSSSVVFLSGMLLCSVSPVASSLAHSCCFVPSKLATKHHASFVGTSRSPSRLLPPFVSHPSRRASPHCTRTPTGIHKRPFRGKSLDMSSGHGDHLDENDEFEDVGTNNDPDSWNDSEEMAFRSSSSDNHIFHDDGIGGVDDSEGEDADTDEGYDYMRAEIKKISWLPSVKLGKQPFKPLRWPISRKENLEGGRYENIDDHRRSRSGSNPPGYRNVETLPVLPMSMVHGLEGILDSNTDDGVYISDEGYATGVWEEESSSIMSSMGPIFSGTSSYLPHTKGHVFTVAEPRYKKLYDDLLRMGSYYGRKRESALRRARQSGEVSDEMQFFESASIPDPDEKRRFIVTVANPCEEGVFAEYGLLFQLRDLDEIGAVPSMDLGDGMTLEDLSAIMTSGRGYDDDEDEEEIMSALLQTHYEAKHDVVGRVKIHRFVNPECWNDGPDSEEYLMAEATILDVVDSDRARMLDARRKKLHHSLEGEDEELAAMSVSGKVDEQGKLKAVGDVASAVARIKEELRSAVGDTFKQQLKSEQIKDDLRSALNDAFVPNSKHNSSARDNSFKQGASKRSIPLVPKGILVDKRSEESLSKEERALRDSFAKLVSLQHELREECRFTRVSVNTFGMGPVGSWLSAAAWSQFLEKRMEASHGDMQSDLQAKLAEYLERRDDPGRGLLGRRSISVSDYESDDDDDTETIDFDELSPELQQEFQLVQARAAGELGPLALERAIQVQRIVQAVTYNERLSILKECVDAERRRLEAKKGLQSALNSEIMDDERDFSRMSRKEARLILERLVANDSTDKSHVEDNGSFQ
ncbi:hypothetical protein ACHAXS_011644 [Conticribra weissflogii]